MLWGPFIYSLFIYPCCGDPMLSPSGFLPTLPEHESVPLDFHVPTVLGKQNKLRRCWPSFSQYLQGYCWPNKKRGSRFVLLSNMWKRFALLSKKQVGLWTPPHWPIFECCTSGINRLQISRIINFDERERKDKVWMIPKTPTWKILRSWFHTTYLCHSLLLLLLIFLFFNI